MIGRYESWLRRRAPLVAVAFPPVAQVALLIACVVALVAGSQGRFQRTTTSVTDAVQWVVVAMAAWGLWRLHRAAWLPDRKKTGATVGLLLFPMLTAAVIAVPWGVSAARWQNAPEVSVTDPRCGAFDNVRLRLDCATDASMIMFCQDPSITHHYFGLRVLRGLAEERREFVEPSEPLVCVLDELAARSPDWFSSLLKRELTVRTPDLRPVGVWAANATWALVLLVAGFALATWSRGNPGLTRDDVRGAVGTLALVAGVPALVALWALFTGRPPDAVTPWVAAAVSTVGLGAALMRGRFTPSVAVVWVAFIASAVWAWSTLVAPHPRAPLIAQLLPCIAWTTIALIVALGGARIRGMME